MTPMSKVRAAESATTASTTPSTSTSSPDLPGDALGLVALALAPGAADQAGRRDADAVAHDGAERRQLIANTDRAETWPGYVAR